MSEAPREHASDGDATTPLPGAVAPGQFPPPADPWADPTPGPPGPPPPASPPGTDFPASPGTDFPASPGTTVPTSSGSDFPASPGSHFPASPGSHFPASPGTDVPAPYPHRTAVPESPPDAAAWGSFPPGAAAPGPAAPGPAVARIGEITVTSATVHTPTGDLPLAGSTWQVADYWQNEQKTPAWAIAAAILGFCVLTVFSLLFLLVKETVYRGTVQVTVTNGQRQYVARIPVRTQAEVQQINQQVNYVRSLAAL